MRILDKHLQYKSNHLKYKPSAYPKIQKKPPPPPPTSDPAPALPHYICVNDEADL
ncbi:hypothetical protein VNI00_006731 [Paramarasmius palmivorus]|uniref:Uncharacterized protein n=1 Tax=Paramarasmius palmivorus TaxID=297713 RepID=A0AAW0D4L4_9AGAR